jgi:MSHA biogenesis protein MshK
VYKSIASSLCILLLSAGACADNGNVSEVRDPTAPLGYTATGTLVGGEQFALNSILISPQRKLAIINGNTLREGEVVPGSADVKVQRILNQAVVLQQADQVWVLRLSPSILKRH